MPSVFDKLGPVLTRYNEIEEAMGRPEVATDFEQVQTLAKERASLESLVDIAHRHRKLVEEQEDLNSLLEDGSDAELVRMAKEELDASEHQLDKTVRMLPGLLMFILVKKSRTQLKDKAAVFFE